MVEVRCDRCGEIFGAADRPKKIRAISIYTKDYLSIDLCPKCCDDVIDILTKNDTKLKELIGQTKKAKSKKVRTDKTEMP